MEFHLFALLILMATLFSQDTPAQSILNRRLINYLKNMETQVPLQKNNKSLRFQLNKLKNFQQLWLTINSLRNNLESLNLSQQKFILVQIQIRVRLQIRLLYKFILSTIRKKYLRAIKNCYLQRI